MAFGYGPGIRVILNPVSKGNGDRAVASSLVGLAKQRAMHAANSFVNSGRDFLSLANGGFIDIRFYGNIVNIFIDVPKPGSLSYANTIPNYVFNLSFTPDTSYFRDLEECTLITSLAQDKYLDSLSSTQEYYTATNRTEWLSFNDDGTLHHSVQAGSGYIVYNGIKLVGPFGSTKGEIVVKGTTLVVINNSGVYTSSLLSAILSEGSSISLHTAINIPVGYEADNKWVWNKSLTRASCIMTKPIDGSLHFETVLLHVDVSIDENGYVFTQSTEDLSTTYNRAVHIDNKVTVFDHTISGEVVAVETVPGASESSCGGSYVEGTTDPNVLFRSELNLDIPHSIIFPEMDGLDVCSSSDTLYGYKITETLDFDSLQETYEGNSLLKIAYEDDDIVHMTAESYGDNSHRNRVTASVAIVRAFGADVYDTFDFRYLPYIENMEAVFDYAGGEIGLKFYRVKGTTKTQIGILSKYRRAVSYSYETDVPASIYTEVPIIASGSVIYEDYNNIPLDYDHKNDIGLHTISSIYQTTSVEQYSFSANYKDRDSIRTIAGPYSFNNTDYTWTESDIRIIGEPTISGGSSDYAKSPLARSEVTVSTGYFYYPDTKVLHDDINNRGTLSTTFKIDNYSLLGVSETFPFTYIYCGNNYTLITGDFNLLSTYGFKGSNILTFNQDNILVDIK